MEKRKDNTFLVINRVNERNNCFRLSLSDGTKLDLPKDELNGFIPASRDSIRIRYYMSLLISEVLINEKAVISRSNEKLSAMLIQMQKQLDVDSAEQAKILELEQTDDYKNLPEVFKHRIKMLKLILKNDFTLEKMKNEIGIYKLSISLSAENDIFIRRFERETAKKNNQFAAAVYLDDSAIIDAKCLAVAYRSDTRLAFKKMQDFSTSQVMNYYGESTKMPLKNDQAIMRYVTAMLVA